jgi:hypothetical protein
MGPTHAVLTIVESARFLPSLADTVTACQASDVELDEDAHGNVGWQEAELQAVSM